MCHRKDAGSTSYAAPTRARRHGERAAVLAGGSGAYHGGGAARRACCPASVICSRRTRMSRPPVCRLSALTNPACNNSVSTSAEKPRATNSSSLIPALDEASSVSARRCCAVKSGVGDGTCIATCIAPFAQKQKRVSSLGRCLLPRGGGRALAGWSPRPTERANRAFLKGAACAATGRRADSRASHRSHHS